MTMPRRQRIFISVTLIIFLLTIFLGMKAQEEQKFSPEKFDAELQLFIVKEAKLTPQEAFMLQGFPPEFATNGQNAGVANGSLYKQAGNAVSVNTIYAVLYYLIENHIIHE